MVNYTQTISGRYLCATTFLAWIVTESLSQHLQGQLLHGSSGWLHPQSSRHLQGLLKSQLWDDALPATAARPCSGSPFLPSLSPLSPAVPALVPGHQAQPAPGAGPVIGKGNCKAPKLINRQWGSVQQPLQGPAQGPGRVGSLLCGGMGLTRTAAPLRAGTAEVRAGWWLAGCWSLLLLLGLPRLWRRAGLEQGTGTAQHSRSSCSPSVFRIASGAAFWPQECHQAPLLCAEVAAIFSSIFYSLTKASKYSLG